MIENLGAALNLLANWQIPLIMFVGVVIGLILGAIPGITGSVAMAASLPLTFYMEPIVAIMFLSATYTGGITGGSISAILLNMPGAPGSVATAIDGFKLTQLGRHNYALGLALYSSVIGTFGSYIMMGICLGPVTLLVRNLGPADRISIAMTAMLIIAALRGRSMLRSLIAGMLGLALGTLGPSQTGFLRSEFLGMPMLYDGLPLVPTIIGLIAFSELLVFLGQKFVVDFQQGKVPKPSTIQILSTVKGWLRYWGTVIIGTVIGFWVGVVPAAGASVSSLFAYGQVKSWSRHSERFGQGEPKGVVASEAANNASEGGAMLPTLALGIPGSGASAILMSGFLMFGLTPGPVWISRNLPFAYAVVLGNLFLAFALIFIGALAMARIATIIYVPVRYLAPALVIISSAGMYSLRSSVFDVSVAWFFAYLGFILKKHDYPPIALLLGLILSPIIDAETYRVSVLYGDNLTVLLTRPVVLSSMIVGVFLIGNPIIRSLLRRYRSGAGDEGL